MKKIFIGMLISVLLIACSKTEERYDDILSYTTWKQSYIDVPGQKPNQSFADSELLLYLLSLSEHTVILTEVENDTIWDCTRIEGEFVLTFENSSCSLTEIRTDKGSYMVRTYNVSTVYYPNQTYTIDNEDKWTYEVTVKDSIVLIRRLGKDGYTYPDMNVSLDGINIRYEKELLKTSDSYPYEKDYNNNYSMTFTRNGRNVVLDGEIHFVGVINKEGDEIEFNDIGTLYKQ